MSRTVLPSIKEKDFQRTLVEFALYQGWMVHHVFEQRHYAKRIGIGFPDLFMVRPPRVVALELKSETGKPTAAQTEWLAQMSASGIEAHLVRPSDWDFIEKVLSRG